MRHPKGALARQPAALPRWPALSELVATRSRGSARASARESQPAGASLARERALARNRGGKRVRHGQRLAEQVERERYQSPAAHAWSCRRSDAPRAPLEAAAAAECTAR